jgi:energy-converting hydrogenase Eha subunit G
MTFIDYFEILTGLVGAAYFAYGIACGVAARRARRTPAEKSETAEAACASR